MADATSSTTDPVQVNPAVKPETSGLDSHAHNDTAVTSARITDVGDSQHGNLNQGTKATPTTNGTGTGTGENSHLVEHVEHRRDSDVGPLGESRHEHQHHGASDNASSSSTSEPKKGISYGNVSHLGTDHGTTGFATEANRRQSLADSPYHGNVDTTVSERNKDKKWSFSMGDFGLKLPGQKSNAVTQHLNRDGSVSDQGGQGRVARGIGSISGSVKRGGVDQNVSQADPIKKWSLSHGDFGLKMPKQESNAVSQELNRDGSVSSQGGQDGPVGGGAGLRKYSGVDSVPLGRQGARGIGSVSSSVRKGSVDATVSPHDKNRKWSLKDADFGLKFPKGPSNLHNETSTSTST